MFRHWNWFSTSAHYRVTNISSGNQTYDFFSFRNWNKQFCFRNSSVIQLSESNMYLCLWIIAANSVTSSFPFSSRSNLYFQNDLMGYVWYQNTLYINVVHMLQTLANISSLLTFWTPVAIKARFFLSQKSCTSPNYYNHYYYLLKTQSIVSWLISAEVVIHRNSFLVMNPSPFLSNNLRMRMRKRLVCYC